MSDRQEQIANLAAVEEPQPMDEQVEQMDDADADIEIVEPQAPPPVERNLREERPLARALVEYADGILQAQLDRIIDDGPGAAPLDFEWDFMDREELEWEDRRAHLRQPFRRMGRPGEDEFEERRDPRNNLRRLERMAFERPPPIEYCEMCEKYIRCSKMMEHIETCAKDNTASKLLKDMCKHKFLSQLWTLHSSLRKTMTELSVNFKQAVQDRSKLEAMVCTTCPTFQEHLKGGCLKSHMKDLFEQSANEICESIMAHYDQFLNCKKQYGMEKIQENHGENFTRIQGWFNDNPVDHETEIGRIHVWYEFRKNTCASQADEKRRYLRGLDELNREKYEQLKHKVVCTVRILSASFERSLTRIKRDPTCSLGRIALIEAANMVDGYETERVERPAYHFEDRYLFNLNY